jgi:peroxiredoxin
MSMNVAKVFQNILLTAVMGLVAFAWSCEERKPQTGIGMPCPRAALTELGGSTVTIPDDFRGRVLVVRFWSDCCSYNINEMEGLGSLHDKYSDRGLTVITVYAGTTGNAARQFREELKIPYPVLLDIDSAVTRQCGVSKLPTTLVIDRSGVIRGKIIGESEKKAWTESYEKLVSGLL